MSERGSIMSEYIYCPTCAAALASYFAEAHSHHKHFCIQQIKGWDGNNFKLPIFAGKIGGGYSGCQPVDFETERIEEIGAIICHPVRFCILEDSPDTHAPRSNIPHQARRRFRDAPRGVTPGSFDYRSLLGSTAPLTRSNRLPRPTTPPTTDRALRGAQGA